jgi:hypothetical protein
MPTEAFSDWKNPFHGELHEEKDRLSPQEAEGSVQGPRVSGRKLVICGRLEGGEVLLMGAPVLDSEGTPLQMGTKEH